VSGLAADLQRICRAAAESLPMTGAAVHVMSTVDQGGVAATSDARSRAVAEAVFTTGEGPSLDAFLSVRPVLISDLQAEGPGRWPGFADIALTAGVAALYSLPLAVGAVQLGVLDLYDGQPRRPVPEDVSLALTFADLATELLLQGPGDGQALGLNERLMEAFDRRSEIYQAQGMVMVDREVTLAEALSLMRAEAFARGLALIDVAREILAGGRFRPRDSREGEA
jgi:GAF domain-containing protein